MSTPDVEAFFDEVTNTISYVVSDPASREAAIIDSVLDFDAAASRTSTVTADKLVAFVGQHDLKIRWILETHAHADHLSAAPYLKGLLGGQIAIGSGITDVQKAFADILNLPDLPADGSQFDVLFADNDEFKIGTLKVKVLHTPGHTPACSTYVVGGAAFVGDTMFMPDFGSARCDFPGGDARVLYESIQKILALPQDTRLFMCHDYKAPGREEFAWETTVASERDDNVHFGAGTSLDEFVQFRTERDSRLGMPKLIVPSIQVNIRAGNLPEPENNGVAYLKSPLNVL